MIQGYTPHHTSCRCDKCEQRRKEVDDMDERLEKNYTRVQEGLNKAQALFDYDKTIGRPVPYTPIISPETEAELKEVFNKSEKSKKEKPTHIYDVVKKELEMRSMGMGTALGTPEHYKGLVQPIDLIEAQNLSFSAGCVVKYICRAKRKGHELEDLNKALYYLNLEIEKAKNEQYK